MLTPKEKRIVLIKYIIHGVSPFAEAPLALRIQMFQAACGVLNIKDSDEELMAIGQECLDYQDEINKSLRGFLTANSETLKHAHIVMAKGNDKMEGLLGKSFVKDALKLLGKGKV